jgi:hypothetical protein
MGPYGNNRKGEKGRNEAKQRGQVEYRFIHVAGCNVFLEEKLDTVGDRLKKAVRADVQRSMTVLDMTAHLALYPDHGYDTAQSDYEYADDLQQKYEEVKPDVLHKFALLRSWCG